MKASPATAVADRGDQTVAASSKKAASAAKPRAKAAPDLAHPPKLKQASNTTDHSESDAETSRLETTSPEPKTAAVPASDTTTATPLRVTSPAAPREPAPPAQKPPAPSTDPQAPPVAPARIAIKNETFVEGDHVVYPTHGVGKVERIATEDIAGHRLELIHITFEENRMTLRVPVAKARTAGLRKLATRKLFDDALNVLRGKARIKRTMWSRRAQEYEAKINSGDPLAIAEVVRDLHRNAGQPDQSFSERQIYEAAMDRLAAELGALDKTDKPTAAVKLAEFLKTV